MKLYFNACNVQKKDLIFYSKQAPTIEFIILCIIDIPLIAFFFKFNCIILEFFLGLPDQMNYSFTVNLVVNNILGYIILYILSFGMFLILIYWF